MFDEPVFKESPRSARFVVQPSESVLWHLRQGRIAKAGQQWRLEKQAYLLGVDVQQYVRMFGRPPLEPEPTSVVYLFGSKPRPDDGDPVKIGYTTLIPRRLDALRAGSVQELMLLKYLEGGKALEAELHEELFLYQIREDWFEMCDEVREAFDRRIEQQARRGVSSHSARRRDA